MGNMEKIRVRFAPSPTGFLHVGNARTALFNWLYARQHDGHFILRIEDTDQERSTVEFEKKLIDDLRWLGLNWDEGPEAGGDFGPYRQSQRLDIYDLHTQRLLEEDKAYHCFCSADDLEEEKKAALAQGHSPIYSGKCRSIPAAEARGRIKAGTAAAIRLKTPGKGEIAFEDIVRGGVSFDLSLLSDPVLVRSNGHPAYNYAVVIDDAGMKITHVIRGEDHISNMPRQILTYQALSLPLPKFAHLSMVMGSDNTRLSKRHGATSVDQFDKDGILATALDNYLSLLGWAPPDGHEILTMEEMAGLFSLDRVSRSAAIFDYDKLHWINRQHMKSLSPRIQAEQAYPHLVGAGILPEKMTEAYWGWLENALASLLEKVDRFSDLPAHFKALLDFSLEAMAAETRQILQSDCARMVLNSFLKKAENIGTLDFEKFASLTKEIKEETGCKGKDLYHPLRVALTTQTSGLDLDKFIPLVEKAALLNFPQPCKNCGRRVAEVLEYLKTE
ncbi:glutamate--tRNA ligase [Acidobacteriota bacterium]